MKDIGDTPVYVTLTNSERSRIQNLLNAPRCPMVFGDIASAISNTEDFEIIAGSIAYPLNPETLSTIYIEGVFSGSGKVFCYHLPSLTSISLADLSLKDIDIFNCPSLIDINVEGSDITSFNYSGDNLATLTLYGNNSLYELNIDCPNLTFLGVSSSSLYSLDLSKLNSLTYLSCSYSYSLSSISFSNSAAQTCQSISCESTNIAYLSLNEFGVLHTLNCAGCPLQFIEITGCTSLSYVALNGASLIEENIDEVLAVLDSSGIHNGFCDLSAGDNAPPSINGLNSKDNLQAKGWTVIIN